MKLSKSATKVIISVVVLLAAVGAASKFMAKPKKKATTVTIAKISKKDLVISTSITGNIKANDEDIKYLQTTQKVSELYVKEGQDVKQGDVLAKGDTTSLEFSLKKAQLNYDSTKLSADNTYSQAQINYENATNAYNDAVRKYNSNKSLYDGKFISQDDLLASQKAVDDAEKQVKLYKLQMENSDLNSASNQQKQLASIQTDIENYTKQISDSTYTANISGKVVKLDVENGAIPQQSKNTIVIEDVSSYKVSFDVTQNDALSIKIGQEADIKLKGSSTKYKGKVTKVGQTASIVSNGTSNESKVNIEVTIDNPDENVKVGYEADATIYLQTKKNVVSVGFDSVKQDASGKKYVFVMDSDKAVKKYVQTGLETDFDVEITDGLKEGESYISNPPETLKENDMVTTQVSGGKKK